MTMRPGTFFSIELSSDRWGVGVVNALGRSGIGYFSFFTVTSPRPPASEDVTKLKPSDVAFGFRTGLSEFTRGRWAVLRDFPAQQDFVLPVPAFARAPVLGEQYFEVHYSSDDPALEERVEPVTAEAAALLPRDGVWTTTTAADMLRHGANSQEPAPSPQQRQVTEYPLTIRLKAKTSESALEQLQALETAIEAALLREGAAELDGDEIGPDGAKLYFSGADGMQTLASIQALLEQQAGWVPVRADVANAVGAVVSLLYDPRGRRWIRGA